MLDADARYCKGLAAAASVADFRWRSARGEAQFKPFGVARPALVNWGGRSAFRFGFGTLTNGSDGRGGQLIEVAETPILQRATSYTMTYITRIPAPMTEGDTSGQNGGVVIGGRVAANYFRSQIIGTNGRLDHRHSTSYAAISTADHRTGQPIAVMVAYDAVASTMTCRVNGAPVSGYTAVSYVQDFAAGDAALAWMIGGYGDTTTQGGTELDIATIAMFQGRCLTDATSGAALAAAEAYLMAERAKYSV